MDVELLLVDAVSKPVEAHIDGFGSVLSDSRVHDAVGSAVVGSNRGWRLWMIHFGQCGSHGNCIFGIHVEGSDFGL